MPRKWDRFAIKAEIQRRGSNLTELAVKNDLGSSTARAALLKPSPAANSVIAQFLGVSLHELWPHWYDKDGNRRLGARQSSRKPKAAPSQNAEAA